MDNNIINSLLILKGAFFMLGSLRDFIHVELRLESQMPKIRSLRSNIPIHQNYTDQNANNNHQISSAHQHQHNKDQNNQRQNQQNNEQFYRPFQSTGRKNYSRNKNDVIPPNYFKKRAKSTYQEYKPQDKTQLLNNFNRKNPNHLNLFKKRHKKNVSELIQSKQCIYRKPLYQNTSLFVKQEITKDYIAKNQLKRKHNLLRAMIRTNQNDNQNQGVSEYQQSFKRLYEGFNSIYAQPILEYKNYVIQENDHELHNHVSLQITKKPKSQLNHRKRIQFQNCLNWAKKHNKKGQFYAIQLGKYQTKLKQEKMNEGHQLIGQISKRLKNISSMSSRQAQ